MPINGGAATKIVDNNVPPVGLSTYPGAYSLSSDGTNLYFQGGGDAGVLKVPVTGGTPVLLQAGLVNNTHVSTAISQIALTGGFLYWSYYGYVYKLSTNGGALTTLVVPKDQSASGPDMLTDGQYLYYLRGSEILKVSLDGTTQRTLLAGYNVTRMAMDDTNLYLAASAGQGIIKIPK